MPVKKPALATGVLEPFKLVSVGSQASGQVKKLYVELGQAVKVGDPIADIDSRTQTNTVENASAGLSNVTAQKAAAEAALATAQANYDRQNRLFDAGAAARSSAPLSNRSLSRSWSVCSAGPQRSSNASRPAGPRTPSSRGARAPEASP